MKKKRLQSIAFVCSVAMTFMSLTGCSPANSETENSTEETALISTDVSGENNGEIVNSAIKGEAVQRDVINVGISADPGDLSPWGPNNTGRTAAANCFYQSLAHVVNGEIIGVLMKDYEISEDGTYMDCYLYDYIFDAAGNHLTASDVVFSFYKCLEIGNIGGLAFISNCEAIDDYTVRFSFATDLYVYDIETLFEQLFVVTQAAYEASPDGMAVTPVSTAPYQVADYTAGYILTCERNENYWQTEESLIYERDRANVETINYYILTESTQMTMALENGSIDMSWAVSNDDVTRFTSTDNFWLFQAPDNLVNQIFLNCADGHATTDVDLRKALYYSINAEAILQSVYNGNGTLCYDTAAQKAPDYQEAWKSEDNYYHYNVEKAQEYLEKWGGDPGSLQLKIVTSNDEEVSNIAQLLQGFFSQIGVTATIDICDSAIFNTVSSDESQWDVLIGNKATANYCTTSWKNCFSKDFFSWGGSMNFIFDDELQRLLDTARLESSHNEETVNAVHQYITENAYGYGCVNIVNNYIVPSFCSSVVCSYKGAVLPGACTYVN